MSRGLILNYTNKMYYTLLTHFSYSPAICANVQKHTTEDHHKHSHIKTSATENISVRVSVNMEAEISSVRVHLHKQFSWKIHAGVKWPSDLSIPLQNHPQIHNGVTMTKPWTDSKHSHKRKRKTTNTTMNTVDCVFRHSICALFTLRLHLVGWSRV